jgi:hypothetical protein
MLGEAPEEQASEVPRQANGGGRGGPPLPVDLDISKSTRL